MNKFLTEIDAYIKQNGIPFREFEISYTYLPKYIDYAITSMIREMNPHIYEVAGAEKYIVGYDKDSNIYLKAIAHDGRTTVIIYTEHAYSNYDHRNVNGRKESELDLYNKACTLKMRESLRKKIGILIEKEFPNINKIDKIKKQYEIMKEINLDDLSTIENIHDEQIDKEIAESVKKINSYINYVNQSYEQDIITYLIDKKIDINYKKPKPDYVKKENSNKKKY